MKSVISFYFLLPLLFVTAPAYAAADVPAADVSVSTAARTVDFTPESPLPSNQPVTLSQSDVFADYLIAPGDAIEITVWKEDGLQQQQFLISPDGTIIFPLVGTITAAGKTITELKNQLTQKLADYISEPSVTIKLQGYQGNTIYVVGKVIKPGAYISGRRLDVLQAISLAGGLTAFASESNISILRRVAGEVKVFPFDYSDVIKGEDLEQNILLLPGDTITVP